MGKHEDTRELYLTKGCSKEHEDTRELYLTKGCSKEHEETWELYLATGCSKEHEAFILRKIGFFLAMRNYSPLFVLHGAFFT